MILELLLIGDGVRGLAPDLGVFGPADLARMGAAFAAALRIASDESGPFGLIGGRELRTSLARAIVREARNGVRDVHQLKARALCALDPEALARSGSGRARRRRGRGAAR